MINLAATGVTDSAALGAGLASLEELTRCTLNFGGSAQVIIFNKSKLDV